MNTNSLTKHQSNRIYDSFNHKSIGQKAKIYPINQHAPQSIPHENATLPLASINQHDLTNNLDWMQNFADHHNVKLCPHGKTTMTPHFFEQQLSNGAWGITVATPAQAEVAAMAGAKNVIMANQLVGMANMQRVLDLIKQYDLNFYCCVDSSVNILQLDTFFGHTNQTLNLLIEFGVTGGRCGCRTEEQVQSLAKQISDSKALKLKGIEVYEGVIGGDNAEGDIRAFLSKTLQLAQTLRENGWITTLPLVTGAGSAWYDVVAETFANLTDYFAVIRPGCYAIHDTGIYAQSQDQVMQRAQNNQGYACDLGGDLSSALEVWAYVISRPEPNKAVIGLGKRDVAFDAGLPIVERVYRNGEEFNVGDIEATAIMDQHMFVSIDADSPLQVGDMIAFSTSHPCLTFDKWRTIAVVDEQYCVTEWVSTYF
ncbi:amino acid deaminase [Vibrio agarivorans]|uniref:Amino acid deaminase n=1 Tax=Vibrio agarivorans TaxID=153622 RepID=A0ABT7XYS3_9VIBR|nr:amino acid deaminase [Vibrio agarivorans]MDN2480921.1 amino acid deaminase [Vibrio agarivorans]